MRRRRFAPGLRFAATALLPAAGLLYGVPGPCSAIQRDQFRNVVADPLASGIKTILNGVVDGVFTLVDTNGSTGSTGSTGSNSVGTTPGQTQ